VAPQVELLRRQEPHLIDYFVRRPRTDVRWGRPHTALQKAPNTYLIIQQQFAFDMGKPMPRVKDFE